MRKALTIVLALAVALLGVTATEASAGQRSRSTIEITKATGDTEHVQVKGTVSSARKICKQSRKVRVYHDSEPPYLIGTTTTDDDGRWEVSSVALPDKVYAVVTRNKNCKKGVSDAVDVTFKP